MTEVSGPPQVVAPRRPAQPGRFGPVPLGVRRDLLRLAEPLAAVVRAAILVNDLRPAALRPGLVVPVAVVAAAHWLLPVLYARRGGPWTRGGRWVLWDVGHGVALVALGALAVRPGMWLGPGPPYALFLGALTPTIAMAGLYPWGGPVLGRRPWVVPALLWLAQVPILAAGAVGSGPLSGRQVLGALVTLGWSLLTVLTVVGVALIARVVARHQLDARAAAVEDSFTFLHSDVKAALARIRIRHRGDAATQRQLALLEAKIADHRAGLLLQQRLVDLASLLRERLRSVEPPLRVAPLPQVGALTLQQADAVALDEALRGLLADATGAGAAAVALSVDVSGDRLRLAVEDDRPGRGPAGRWRAELVLSLAEVG